MSEIEGIEEIFEQTSIRVDRRTKHGNFGWAIPPSIERASAAHEPKPAKATACRQPVETQMNPAITSKRNGATLGRLIADYRSLVETCRARADELDLSRMEIDRLGGLPAGYAGKLLGKDAVDDVGFPRKKNSKKMWPVALESMLGVLGLKILLIEDEAATARTLALRTPVDRGSQRFETHFRNVATPPPAPQPPLRLIQGKRRGGKYG